MRRSGAALKRIVLETVGWALVVAGIAALVLPGPGLLMLFAGLVVLSQQYDWAERWVAPVEVRAKRAAAESVKTWPRIIASTLGGVWLMCLGILYVLDPAVPGWWPFEDSWWLLGGLATGITLIASAVIAWALIIYSYRRWRGADPAEVEQEAREHTP